MAGAEGQAFRRYRVEGHVQGVGFRRWTLGIAGELGVEGAVRNRPDGTVEVVARGDACALDALERSLRMGPARSRVERVRVLPECASWGDGEGDDEAVQESVWVAFGRG